MSFDWYYKFVQLHINQWILKKVYIKYVYINIYIIGFKLAFLCSVVQAVTLQCRFLYSNVFTTELHISPVTSVSSVLIAKEQPLRFNDIVRCHAAMEFLQLIIFLLICFFLFFFITTAAKDTYFYNRTTR